MKKNIRKIGASAAVFAATALCSQAATTVIDASTNNGSFETIDNHNASITNTTRRAENGSTEFIVGDSTTVNPATPVHSQGSWLIGGGGFHGVDTTGTAGGPVDGTSLLLINDGASLTALSGSIPLVVSIGDSFDLSAFTLGNNANGVFDYDFTLRFDGNSGTDVSILAGTHTSTTVTWMERTATTYVSTVNATSVQLLISATNSAADPVVDQVYIDNVTLTSSVPEPSSALLACLALPLLARRRR